MLSLSQIVWSWEFPHLAVAQLELIRDGHIPTMTQPGRLFKEERSVRGGTRECHVLSYLQSKSGAATVSVQHHNSVSETWSKKCSWFGYFTDIITDYLDNTQHESAEQTNKHSQIKSTALKARCMLLMIFSERATCDHFLDRMNYCCSKPEWKLQIDNFMCS